jgi:hypothetical protein
LVKIDLSPATTLQLYEDPEFAGLRFTIKTLAQELTELQRIKTEIERKIHTLHARHRLELGQLIAELLRLRRGQNGSDGQTNPRQRFAGPETEIDDESYEKLQRDQLPRLTPEEQRALKVMFRQACKLCHPDVVADEFKAEASQTFIELKAAYKHNNLARVKEIWQALEQGQKLTQMPELIRDKDRLQAQVNYLSSRVQAIRQEITQLKQSKAYQKLVNIEDWDDYFDELKGELQRKINRLRRKRPLQL